MVIMSFFGELNYFEKRRKRKKIKDRNIPVKKIDDRFITNKGL